VPRDFLPYDLDQHYLLPPDMREWLPRGAPGLVRQ